MGKKRNSNLDLLKIIAMLLILISHYSVHNGINNYLLNFGVNRVFLDFCVIGNIGTILFVMITGYFMVERKNINFKRIFSLIIQVLFYSMILYFLSVKLGIINFSLKEFIKNIFPVLTKRYWFISAYLMLSLFSPFINNLLNHLEKKQFKLFLFLIFIFTSVFRFFMIDIYTNDLFDFIFYYSLGAYIKKYNINYANRKKLYCLLFGSFFIIVASVIVMCFCGKYYNYFNLHSTYLLNRFSPLIIIISYILFYLIYSSKEIINHKVVNLVAANTLGVYLISDNMYFRNYIWNSLFKNYLYVNSSFLVLHFLITISLVYIICIFLHSLIKKIVNDIFLSLFKNIVDLVNDKINKYFI